MNEPRRKLAAIVFTDIVGFTKLTANNQSKASSLLKKQRELFQPIIKSYNGKWIKEMGDGLLLTFDTVTDAVNCCINLQETSKQIDDLTLRIGIHQGEILVEENDIIGDDVNVAARIEPFSAPGGIAISSKVHDAIIREEDFDTKYLGKPKLKGVGQKVEVYCLTSHGLKETVLSDVSAKLEPEGFQWNFYSLSGAVLTAIGILFWINISFIGIGVAYESEVASIAVLPFENKGELKDDFYAYGISSDLITDVTKAGLIRVAGLNDIEKLEYKKMSYNELSDELFVRYVAKGTLWKMDTIFQLSMEIFDTEHSKVVYNKRWQTHWKDLTVIKDDLSDNILNTLKIEIRESSKDNIVDSNPEAYEYYLRGKHQYGKSQNLDDIEIARGLLRKAITMDENLLDAKLSLGGTYTGTGDYKQAMDIFISSLNQAQDLGQKRTTDNFLNEIGILHYYQGKADSALYYWEEAVELCKELGNKNLEMGITANMGNAYWNKGEYGRAIEIHEKALEYSELSDNKKTIGIGLSNLGYMYQVIREFEKSINYLERSIAINEELDFKGMVASSLKIFGDVFANYKGDLDRAHDYYSKSLSISQEMGYKRSIGTSNYGIGDMYARQGNYIQALDYFDRYLKIVNEMGDKGGKAKCLNVIGLVYYEQSQFEKAENYFVESHSMSHIQGDSPDAIIWTNVLLNLTKKELGKDYNNSELRGLISKVNYMDYRLNYYLYELMDEQSYLITASNQLQEKIDGMDKDLKQKYLNYPLPKKVMDKSKKLNI